MRVPLLVQVAGAVLVTVGVGVALGYAVGLIVAGAALLAFGISEER